MAGRGGARRGMAGHGEAGLGMARIFNLHSRRL